MKTSEHLENLALVHISTYTQKMEENPYKFSIKQFCFLLLFLVLIVWPIYGFASDGEEKRFSEWDIFLSRVPEKSEMDSKNFIILDAFDTSRDLVSELHRSKIFVACYINAGSFEHWRPDMALFPKKVIGRAYSGWDGEFWLDISAQNELLEIMKKRVLLCREKGFDGVDFDNMDGYQHKTGFKIAASDQLSYNKKLADMVHAVGLKTGMRNTPELANQLEKYFDWVLSERCAEDNFCSAFQVFVQHHKPVFNIEYKKEKCNLDDLHGIFSILKESTLSRSAEPCGGETK